MALSYTLFKFVLIHFYKTIKKREIMRQKNSWDDFFKDWTSLCNDSDKKHGEVRSSSGIDFAKILKGKSWENYIQK